MNTLLAQVQTAVDSGVLEDINTKKSEGGSSRKLPLGRALVRFTGYIEIGKHEKEYQGKKSIVDQYQLQFHIVGGKGKAEDGSIVDFVEDGKQFTQTTFPNSISYGDLAGYVKLFKVLSTGRNVKHFAELLNSVYYVPTVTAKKKDGTEYIKFDWSKATEAVDLNTYEPIQAPEVAPNEFKLFLWSAPTQEQWDSLFIEGEWEGRDGKPAQSKNKFQEAIQNSKNFVGSPIENLLSGGNIPDLTVSTEMPEVPNV